MRDTRKTLWIFFFVAGIVALFPIWIVTHEPKQSVAAEDAPILNSTRHLNESSIEGLASEKMKQTSVARLSHPHAGARYANGSWGYVVDVQMVRRSVIEQYQKSGGGFPGDRTMFRPYGTDLPPPSYLIFRDEKEFAAACNAKPREGKERKAGWRLLTQKVKVNGPDPLPLLDETPINPFLQASDNQSASELHNKPRILCAVYTYEKRHAMVNGVGETWGWKCDGFFAASTKTVDDPQADEDGLGAVDLPHKGPEKYDNMWQKTRSILSYMHDFFIDEFDFFFLSGDDTFVIVENLRRMLVSLGDSAEEFPLYLGHWVPDGRAGNYFCGGGPGYVLNRKSLAKLVKDILPKCLPDLETSAEDRTLGYCFRQFGITGNHSVDAANAQRFHGMDPHDTCTMKGESGFFGRLYKFWGEIYGFKTGFNLTSSQSVSFHMLKTARHLKRIYAILYNSCPANTTLYEALEATRT